MLLVIGVSENGPLVDRWKWSRPDVSIYTTLVQGLAALLRVSDALRMIDDICRVGVSPGEEVWTKFFLCTYLVIKDVPFDNSD